MPEIHLLTDTLPVKSVPHNRWWARPAFGMILFGFLFPFNATYGWWFEGNETPTVKYLSWQLLVGVATGVLWGFGGNWVASWGKKNLDLNGLPKPPP